MPSPLAILGGQPVRTRPFPPWPIFDARERAQLEDVLTSSSWGGYPSPNRKAAEFAAAFGAYQGARFAIPTTSGTSALEVALKSLGIGAGDEVIVPAITFAATPYAAVACMVNGLTPVVRDPRTTREVIYAFIFIRALRAEGIPCGVANDPVYRSALFPRESDAYRKVCELARANPAQITIDCPVAERLFEHALVSIPHQCLLGDDRDLEDIVAAIVKAASRATELASANLQ